ncbi:MAG: hypothetical protein ABJA87_03675 [bacterium]
MNVLPIVYIRGYAGATAGINSQVDDPFYGFNAGATHVRIDGDGDPSFYQFEGPLLRLVTEHHYQLLVHGDQRRLLDQPGPALPAASIWVHRFYDSAATTFTGPRHENLWRRMEDKLHRAVTADGFNLEHAAEDLYDLIEAVQTRTGAPRVYVVAHSMGGLVARCMMQKVCRTPRQSLDGTSTERRPARELIDKLFTYGTPHGGIVTDLSGVNAAMEVFGPAGSDIFSPPKMYGYLTPGASFGDLPPDGEKWDPRDMPDDVFDVNDIFCLIGTDPTDYGASRAIVGPKSDGLVRIENAYVKGAHRAYVFKSHSGSYGEVNSEEGYQNLRRFLFGRWAVAAFFAGLTADLPNDGTTWQADMRLAIRGLPIVMSEQQAAHWCPIILNKLAASTDSGGGGGEAGDQVDAPVPIVSTFLLEPEPPSPAHTATDRDGLSRYVITLRVYKVVEDRGAFNFRDHIEQVSDWTDSLIVDVGPDEAGTGGAAAWSAWKSDLPGAIDSVPRMPNRLGLSRTAQVNAHVGTLALPSGGRALPIFGDSASLSITVEDRTAIRRNV